MSHDECIAAARACKTCEVPNCNTNARYECPRCAIAFCSVSCYKSHSSACTTEFEAQATEGLRGIFATEDDKTRMRHMLQRIHEQESRSSDDCIYHGSDSDRSSACDNIRNHGDSNESEIDIDHGSNEMTSEESFSFNDEDGIGDEEALSEADILEQLLDDLTHSRIDYDEALSRLPPHLSQKFLRQLNDGRISRLLPLWQPWWLCHAASNKTMQTERVVSEESLRESPSERTGEEPPTEPSRKPRLPVATDFDLEPSSAIAVASTLIIYSVLDVTASYCTAMRACNGDWSVSSQHAFGMLWSCSGALSENARYSSLPEVASAILSHVSNPVERGLEALADSALIFRRHDYLKRAMLDARSMLAKASGEDASQGAMASRSKRTHFAADKKLGFFLAWSCGASKSVLTETAEDVEKFVSAKRRQLHGSGVKLDVLCK